MSYRKISWSLEVARFVFRIVRSLWNLTGTSAALLPMCLSNFEAIRQFKVPISWLGDFTRSHDKTSFRILRRGTSWPFIVPPQQCCRASIQWLSCKSSFKVCWPALQKASHVHVTLVTDIISIIGHCWHSPLTCLHCWQCWHPRNCDYWQIEVIFGDKNALETWDNSVK